MPIPLPSLHATQANDTRSASGSGPVISGGQSNGVPWYVWVAAGVVAIVFLLRD